MQIKLSDFNKRSFKGAKMPSVDNLKNIDRFINHSKDSFTNKLFNSIRNSSPNNAKVYQGVKYIKDFSFPKKVLNATRSFASVFVGPIDWFAKKFPKTGLNNSKFLQKYRNSLKLENEINAMQGLYSTVTEKIDKILKDSHLKTSVAADFNKMEEIINLELQKKLNAKMATNVANYDTKQERLTARLVSGFTAALFLGNDFYNKAIQKGKTKEEAKEEQFIKQKQEFRENICEGVAQFALLACFSKWVNKNVWVPAILGAAISFVSRIISRKTTNMPIFRVKVPEQSANNMLSMQDYMKKTKTGNDKELLINKKETKKEPVLSLKNIFKFCLVSCGVCFLLKLGKENISLGENITGRIKKVNDKLDHYFYKDVVATKSSLEDLVKILDNNGEKSIAEHIKNKVLSSSSDKINLGTDYKTVEIFGTELRTKGLFSVLTSPIRFVKETFTYPYKIVKKLAKALIKKKDAVEVPDDKVEKIKDIYDIKNIYNRFVEFKEKYGDDKAKLNKEFGDYLYNLRILSNNNISSSSTDNSKIAVLAQTLGTLTGIWFNMNDEFNSSVRNGSTKQEAEKDARLRGINKFFRMSVQVIISGALNSIFVKQYNNSIAKAGLVVALSTMLTDSASRVLTGMPTKKMTKEELEQYRENHKKGFMSWYYKLIDKLAS